jgi:hypothetical protein
MALVHPSNEIAYEVEGYPCEYEIMPYHLDSV